MNKLIKRASAEARAFRSGRDTDGDNVDNEAGHDVATSKSHADKAGKVDRAAKAHKDKKHKKARRADRADRAASLEGAPKIDTPRKPRFAPVTFSEESGVRYLHFGTEWVQGAMRLKKPNHIELEYAQQMMAWLLFLQTPKRIVQLGLGAAALTKFAHRYLKRATVEAVELNPAVVVAARTMFELPPDDDRLTVREADAWDFVHDRANHGTVGALQIDLYDATARGPVLDGVAFYRAARACLTEAGVVTVNLFGDHPSFVRNMERLSEAFEGRVIALPEVHEGNRVAIAFSGPAFDVPFGALKKRAKLIEKKLDLPARQWLAALKKSSGQDGDSFTI